jgi:prepilin-type N-terminal cleavage/methylation domain-containing protein
VDTMEISPMIERRRPDNAFTMVELMMVVLIVGILAAVAIPLYSGRIDKAKWTEADAAAGTIRTAVRVYWAEKGGAGTTWNFSDITGDITLFGPKLGITPGGLNGNYFKSGCYVINSVNSATGNSVITINATLDPGSGGAPTSPSSKVMAEDGTLN